MKIGKLDRKSDTTNCPKCQESTLKFNKILVEKQSQVSFLKVQLQALQNYITSLHTQIEQQKQTTFIKTTPLQDYTDCQLQYSSKEKNSTEKSFHAKTILSNDHVLFN